MKKIKTITSGVVESQKKYINLLEPEKRSLGWVRVMSQIGGKLRANKGGGGSYKNTQNQYYINMYSPHPICNTKS